jgi:chromosome segregation ATPase
MEQPELERRTVQNTNDILSIYDLLSGMEATLARHTIQLSNIQHRLETQDAKLDAHDARFDAHDARFDAHDARFDAHDARFDAIDRRFDHLDTSVAEILRRLPG